MRRLTIAAIAVLTGLALLFAALPAHAAVRPRAVTAGDAAAASVEVPISTKQVTLIHFDVGDVSMVAVGDSAMVHVTAVESP